MLRRRSGGRLNVFCTFYLRFITFYLWKQSLYTGIKYEVGMHMRHLLNEITRFWRISTIMKLLTIINKAIQIQSAWKVSKYGFFWSTFSRTRVEYGDLRNKSQYSARIRENTDQNKLYIWALFTLCQFAQRT